MAVCSWGMERGSSSWAYSESVAGDGGGDQHPAQTHPVGLWVLRGGISSAGPGACAVWGR